MEGLHPSPLRLWWAADYAQEEGVLAEDRLRGALTTHLFLLLLWTLLDLSSGTSGEVTAGEAPGLLARSSNYKHLTVQELTSSTTGEAFDVKGIHCCQRAVHLSDLDAPTHPETASLSG